MNTPPIKTFTNEELGIRAEIRRTNRPEPRRRYAVALYDLDTETYYQVVWFYPNLAIASLAARHVFPTEA